MIDLEAIRTLADIPAAQARKRGDAVAVKFGDRETTFAELDDQSNRVANALVASGVAPLPVSVPYCINCRYRKMVRNGCQFYVTVMMAL